MMLEIQRFFPSRKMFSVPPLYMSAIGDRENSKQFCGRRCCYRLSIRLRITRTKNEGEHDGVKTYTNPSCTALNQS